MSERMATLVDRTLLGLVIEVASPATADEANDLLRKGWVLLDTGRDAYGAPVFALGRVPESMRPRTAIREQAVEAAKRRLLP